VNGGQVLHFHGGSIFHDSFVHSLDISIALSAKIDSKSFLLFTMKIPQTLLRLGSTERTIEAWMGPLLATELAVEMSLTCLVKIGHIGLGTT
jgi:acyl-CoA thioesterase